MADLSNDTNLIRNLFSVSGIQPENTYTYQFRDTFYQLVPANFKPYYYNVIRRSLNWYSGYVPEVHIASTGMFSTSIGNMIVKEVTKLIMGGKIFTRNVNKEQNQDSEKSNSTLDRFSRWSKFYKFENELRKHIEYTAAGGTGALKLNVNLAGDLEARSLRIDQFFFETDFRGSCNKFTGFLKSYTAKLATKQGLNENFYLLEERYFNEYWEPKIKVTVKRDFGQVSSAQSFDPTSLRSVKWEQLPKEIRHSIKSDYGNSFNVDEENDLPFNRHLGVLITNYTTANRIPEVKLGEPVLLNVFSYLFDYDYMFSSIVTDQYLGRGKVIVPANISKPDQRLPGGYYEGYNKAVFTKTPMVNAENQKPLSVQFDLRMNEWEKNRNILAENIAAGVGMAGSDMFTFLRDATGSKTATQIASESQKTISYIEEKRSIFMPTINEFIKIWREFYNETDDFTIRFSSQNMVNKLVTVEEVRVMKEIGFSKFDTFQAMFPGLDESQIWEMVKRSDKEKEEMIKMQAEANATAQAKNFNNNPESKGIKEKEEKEEIS